MKYRLTLARLTTLSTSVALATAGCVAAVLAGGCYKNIVGVKGPATQSYDIHEANIEPGESMWSEDKPHVVDPNRYAGGTTVERAKPVPAKPVPKKYDNGN